MTTKDFTSGSRESAAISTPETVLTVVFGILGEEWQEEWGELKYLHSKNIEITLKVTWFTATHGKVLTWQGQRRA